MKDNLRYSLRSAFFEALFVVFGVVLALAANEWRQDVTAREKAESALASMKAELESNRDLVAASIEYHQAEVQMLQSKMRQGILPDMEDFTKGFISPAWVTDTAWETARETGVLAELDYQVVLDLSASYDRLEHYSAQAENVGKGIYEMLLSEGADGLRKKPTNLMTIVYTFIYRESQLLVELDQIIARLK